MEIWIKSLMVALAISLVIKMLFILLYKYPRKSEVKMGKDVIDVLIGFGFIVWGLNVLFIKGV